MKYLDTYSIIKALMEKDLLVIQHQELVEWLFRLQLKGEITEEEIQDLLQLYQLKSSYLLISKPLVTAFN